MNLDVRIERQEPGLSDGRNLRRIRQFEKEVPAALAVVVRKIRGFRLLPRQDRFDLLAELSGLRRRVARFDRDVDFEQNSHACSSQGLDCDN